MNKNNVIKFPDTKSRKQRDRLKEDFSMKASRRKSWTDFLGVILTLVIISTSLVYVISLITT